MKSTWGKIEERYPFIAAYGCAAHGTNLLIQDIMELPDYTNTATEAAKIVRFVNNHHMCTAKFEAKRKEAGVKHKLSSVVPTCWYTQYTSAKDLLDAKVLLRRIAHEDSKELEDIKPKVTSLAALELMKSDNFWGRLEELVDVLELPTKVIGEF